MEFGGRETCLLLELFLEIAAITESAVLGDGLVGPMGVFRNDTHGLVDAQFVHPSSIGEVVLLEP